MRRTKPARRALRAVRERFAPSPPGCRFKDAYRLPFAVLWPLLALFSASFREQLARVIRDTDGGSAPPPPPRRAEDAKE